MSVLATILTHSGRVPLYITRRGFRFIERGLEEQYDTFILMNEMLPG
jgi:hypothetical protein